MAAKTTPPALKASEFHPRYCIVCKTFLGLSSQRARQPSYCGDPVCFLQPQPVSEENSALVELVYFLRDALELNPFETSRALDEEVTPWQARSFIDVRNRRAMKYVDGEDRVALDSPEIADLRKRLLDADEEAMREFRRRKSAQN